MFSINPYPKVETRIKIKSNLTDDESQMVNYLKTGVLPDSVIALSHVDKQLAMDDSSKQIFD